MPEAQTNLKRLNAFITSLLPLAGITLALFCTGCCGTFFRPLDAQSVTHAKIAWSDEKNLGAGLTFHLINPPHPELVYLIAQSFPQSYVLVDQNDRRFSHLYQDSNVHCLCCDCHNSGAKNKQSQPNQIELKRFLIFHNNKVISVDTIPQPFLTEPCIKLKWLTYSDQAYDQLCEEVHKSSGYYYWIAALSLIDLTGLTNLPMKRTERQKDLYKLESKYQQTETTFTPAVNSSYAYNCGWLWGLGSRPFTDVGGGYYSGIGISPSNLANTIQQAFSALKTQYPNQDYSIAATAKCKIFANLFAREGYLVSQFSPDIKTMCLIRKKQDPRLYYWKKFDGSKNTFQESRCANTGIVAEPPLEETPKPPPAAKPAK